MSDGLKVLLAEGPFECLGRGPISPATRGWLLRRRRDGLRHDGRPGIYDERRHDGRRHDGCAVHAVVLVAAHSPDRRGGSLDRWPVPAALALESIRPHTITPACGQRGARRCRPYSAPSARPRTLRPGRVREGGAADCHVRTTKREVAAPAAQSTTPWK